MFRFVSLCECGPRLRGNPRISPTVLNRLTFFFAGNVHDANVAAFKVLPVLFFLSFDVPPLHDSLLRTTPPPSLPSLFIPPPPPLKTTLLYPNFFSPQETLVDVLSVVPSVLFVAFDLRLWGFLRFLRLLRWADVTIMVNSWKKSRTTESGGQHTAPTPGTTGEETEGAEP